MTKNKKEILTNEAIKNMVHRIREKDVMLDFDLARIFGYTTKSLNQQVRRNLDRFKEGSIFQLTVEESKNILKSQIVTSSVTSSLDKNSQNDVQGNKFVTLNSGRGSNIKYYPYAFTIEGIEVLSTILYGDSIKDNYIKIFNYFNKTNDIVYSENTSIYRLNLMKSKYEIARFIDGDFSLDVAVSREEDTVWLTQDEIANLYVKDVTVISRHIKNILDEGECNDSNLQKMQFSNSVKSTIIYDLEMIIAVGYRVKSKRATLFRKWSNSILRNFIIKGYAIDNKRCLEHSDTLLELEKDYNNLLKQIDTNELQTKKNTKDIKELKINQEKLLKFLNNSFYNEHFLILNGERIEADIAYQSIFKLAKSSIYIIDDYIDIKTLELLKVCNKSIDIIISSDNKAKNSISVAYINDFIKDTSINISFRKNNNRFHDRYIIIDFNQDTERLYHSGASIKDAGNRITTITEIKEKDVYRDLFNDVIKKD